MTESFSFHAFSSDKDMWIWLISSCVDSSFSWYECSVQQLYLPNTNINDSIFASGYFPFWFSVLKLHIHLAHLRGVTDESSDVIGSQPMYQCPQLLIYILCQPFCILCAPWALISRYVWRCTRSLAETCPLAHVIASTQLNTAVCKVSD